MYVCMHACMHACMHVCMHVCICVCDNVNVYVYIYMYICIYICIYVYIYVYICIYVYILKCICILRVKYIYRRKFRSQTSDNMDAWKSTGGKSKKEDQQRESLRRKKIQVREKAGKSRNTVFFQ